MLLLLSVSEKLAKSAVSKLGLTLAVGGEGSWTVEAMSVVGVGCMTLSVGVGITLSGSQSPLRMALMDSAEGSTPV